MAKEDSEITRREFVAQTSRTAAGVVAGAAMFGKPEASAAPAVSNRVIGANDRVNVASIGIRGQGNSLKRGFARLKNVEVKTLCDVDANLFDARLNDKSLANVHFRPACVQDLRRVLDDKDIDAVVIATPNHWHALATIWALQAGKHVYVEKPASYTVWEGRKMVEAARKYNRIVQVGTMNRSRPAVIEAIKFLHDGGLGEVYMARGLCFKPRPSIGKYPDGPMKAGEKYKLNVESREYEPTYDEAYLAKVDYDLWLGPAAKRPFNRNRFHYNWHWHWDYGNADSGNQGPHQFDIARWGLNKNEHPTSVTTVGGLFADGDTSQETPNVETSVFTYADGKVLEFATRGTYTNDEGLHVDEKLGPRRENAPPPERRIGNLFYGSKGWMWIDGNGRDWQTYIGRRDERGPGSQSSTRAESGGGSDPNVLTSEEGPHYRNFIDAIRAGDYKKLTCDIEDGHLSAALAHLGNISYRVGGRRLQFDGKKEKFVNDAEADKLLTRTYRAPYVINEKV
jgi:predicted dehydrogenase